MTEIPEHLLARSRARKGGAAAAPTPEAAASAAPAETKAAAPAKADAAPARPKPVKVDSPQVAYEKARPKVPPWAAVMLVALPIWALIYAFTLDPETPKELGPLAAGAQVYSTKGCAGCHGGTGDGSAAVPALSKGEVLKTFKTPAEQVRWVFLGSDGYKAKFGATYGDTKKPVKGGMPAWGTLTPDELMDVVLHERATLSGEKFDLAKWQEVEKVIEEIAPNQAAGYKAVLEEWKATPPTG